MGHYAAEMCGDDSGTPKKQPNKDWLVDHDFTIIMVDDFDKKYGTVQTRFGVVSGHPALKRHGWTHYKTREEAEVAARIKCEAAVEEARNHLTTIKKTLKVDRPWEKK